MDQKKYYTIASEASQEIDTHPGLRYLKNQVHSSKSVLDVGCGEGTKLAAFASKKQKAVGIDVNRYAIKLAQKKYPHLKFVHARDEQLPFVDGEFNLVYSTFVLEHTRDYHLFLKEMVRVTSSGGQIIIICPNFGAPNRRSPNSVQSPVKKLISGFFHDFTDLSALNWIKVKPKKKYVNIDDDTTVEPYLKSLHDYFSSLDLEIIKSTSLWSLEPFSFNPRKLLFTFLGRLGIFPFKYWGPQIFVVVNKR